MAADGAAKSHPKRKSGRRLSTEPLLPIAEAVSDGISPARRFAASALVAAPMINVGCWWLVRLSGGSQGHGATQVAAAGVLNGLVLAVVAWAWNVRLREAVAGLVGDVLVTVSLLFVSIGVWIATHTGSFT
jgi:hypothetical protein